MKRIIRRIALAAPVAVAGLFLGLSLPSGGSAGLAGMPRPERELAEAQRIAGYPLRLPAWLPAGAVLERVSWPPVDPDGRAGAFDVWYRAGGKRIHLWQSAATSLEKDPTGRGEIRLIRGREWWVERADLGIVFTTRMADGLTLQVSGRLTDAVLARIAGSFDFE